MVCFAGRARGPNRSSSRTGWLRRLLLGSACAVVACSSGVHSPSTSSESSEAGNLSDRPKTGSAKPSGRTGDQAGRENEVAEQALRVKLYDPAKVPSFELAFNADAMAVLTNPDPATEKTWVRGDFRFGDIAIKEVGVRRKGSTTYQPLPGKSSLKVKFNKFVKGQKLYGVEELTLNNMKSDPTFLAERLTYHIFRELGRPAPMANTSQLKINGEDYGIYANIETPDENFLERAFGKKKTVSLYEVNWGGSWMPSEDDGFEIDIAHPNAAPGKMPDAERLFDAVAAAQDATLLQDLDCCLHTSGWLQHSAAEAVTGHYDGYAFGLWGAHNYFLAGDEAGRFAMVPWSADLTLSDRMGVVDASTPKNSIVLARCKISAPCWEAYKSEVRSFLTKFESLGLVDLAHQWHDQIEGLVRSDPKVSIELKEHDDDTQSLYVWLASRPGVIRAQLGL